MLGLVATSVPARAAVSGPCDIYAAGGTSCVAAHSTVRALYGSYNGPLYQVQRASDNATTNIGLLSAGGYANAGAQDSFCGNTRCTITRIYDQSPRHNDLTIEGTGGVEGQDSPAPAEALPVTVGGVTAHGVEISPGVGYRDDSTSGVAVNGQPEGMYMVASATHVNGGCCFDYGNAEVNNHDTGNGHMDAVNLSTTCWNAPCFGSGPWVQGDMENGLYQGSNGSSSASTGVGTLPFVAALIKNDGQNHMAIKDGNSQSGGLRTTYSGPEPTGPDHLARKGFSLMNPIRRLRIAGLAAVMAAAFAVSGQGSAVAAGPPESAHTASVAVPAVVPSNASTLSSQNLMDPRVIRLAHSGSANGTLVTDATAFPGGGPVGAIFASPSGPSGFTQIGQVADSVAQSSGLCCTTIVELPRQIGSLSAGTLLWAGSVGQNDHQLGGPELVDRQDDPGTRRHDHESVERAALRLERRSECR